MPNLNHVTLLGNCTRDPEIRYTPAGMAVCTIGMAINHAYGTGDQRREETCFVDVVCFGKTAELASEHLAKGTPVMVDGRLQFQTWEGQDGMKRSKHTVNAQTVQWFSGSGASSGSGTRDLDPAQEQEESRTPERTEAGPARQAPAGWGQGRQGRQAAKPAPAPSAEQNAPDDDIPF